MVNINNAFPGDFLKAADLQGRDVPVTISHVEMKDVGGDHKPVVFFQGKDRGLVLNKTNANSISDMYGPETDTWGGREITLYSADVEFQGRMVEAIRVRGPNNMTVSQFRHQQGQAAQAPVQNYGTPASEEPPLNDGINF